MGKSFTNIKGRTSNKKAAGQKIIRPRVVTAVTTRSIRVFSGQLKLLIYVKGVPNWAFIWNGLLFENNKYNTNLDRHLF